jgi:hypothetical protein
MATNRKAIIELLSIDYPKEKIIQVIDLMIQQQGLNPTRLPDDFADKIISSFEIVEEQKKELPNSSLAHAEPSEITLKKATAMGIDPSMLQLTATVVLGKISSQIDDLFGAANQLISQKINNGCQQLGQSVLKFALAHEIIDAEELIRNSGIQVSLPEQDNEALAEYLNSLDIEISENDTYQDFNQKISNYHAAKK